MCVNFEKNRLIIDDVRSWFPFFINSSYHHYNIQNSENFQMTLTFDLYLTLTLSLTFDLDDLKKTNCFKICDLFEVTWRKNVISYVKSETTCRMRPSTRNIFHPTRSLYDFRFKSYGSKDDFHGYWRVWPWPWHLKVIWFLSIHIAFPCMTGLNFEAICSLIAEI